MRDGVTNLPKNCIFVSFWVQVNQNRYKCCMCDTNVAFDILCNICRFCGLFSLLSLLYYKDFGCDAKLFLEQTAEVRGCVDTYHGSGLGD